MVVLVDSSASLDTINRLKFNDGITGQKVQSNVQALLNGGVPANASGFFATAIGPPTQLTTASSNVTEAKVADAVGNDANSVADNVTILGIGNNHVARISTNNTIGGPVAINGVKSTSPTNSLFFQ